MNPIKAKAFAPDYSVAGQAPVKKQKKSTMKVQSSSARKQPKKR